MDPSGTQDDSPGPTDWRQDLGQLIKGVITSSGKEPGITPEMIRARVIGMLRLALDVERRPGLSFAGDPIRPRRGTERRLIEDHSAMFRVTLNNLVNSIDWRDPILAESIIAEAVRAIDAELPSV